jgi:glucose/arabinose dehydrogenase
MRTFALAIALTLLAAVPAAAAPRLELLGNFASPVGITAPPQDGSRVMVVEKGGTVRMIRNGVRVAQPFLDVSAITLSTDEERGLLSIAFPPDYESTGLFYAFLTAKDPVGEVQIREFQRADADHAVPGIGRLVFSAEHPKQFHNGGQLQFGPDGMLWFTIGDGQNEVDAQDTSKPYGKINRIDPHPSAGRGYTVPAGNPFGNTVWAYGLRNPWRFSFDRGTGDLIIGDVGDGSYEEIDYAPASAGRLPGANYGWPCKEGRHNHAGSCAAGPLVNPIIEQPHADGWIAIIGGYVVRDPGLPTLAGRYLYGDFSQSAMHAQTVPAGTDGPAGLTTDTLAAMGEDACGRLYTASLNGPVSRIVDGTPSPCNPDGTAPPPGGTPVPTADTTPCTLSLKATGTRRVTVRRYLRLRVRSNEACRLTVSGRVPGRLRFRTRHRSVKAANRKLRRATRGKRSVRVKVRLRGVDAAGNARVLTKRVRVRH